MVSRLIAGARSLWRGMRRTKELDAEMHEEFRLHLELRAADLVRAGLSPDEAARQARLEFGSTESYVDKGRESRGLRRIDQLRVSWLDFKLGFRMLARYPGLTVIGGLAITFAIWVGAGAFEILTQVVHPTIPLDEGDRIVAVRLWDAKGNRIERRALHDFVAWRKELSSVENLSAQRSAQRNLVVEAGGAGPIAVAEVTASTFQLARVRPLLGRTIVEGDEQTGAPEVLVIGYDVWQRHFGGDPRVVGRTAQLSGSPRTIVGVMPEGFAFPVAHEAWVPLRLSVVDAIPGQGPAITGIFGRLAPGFSLREARTELNTIGSRRSEDFPVTHHHLRPQAMRYAQSILNLSGVESAMLMSVNIFLVMLLVLVCGNVALLMFARAATRESEIVVRTALGASRARIITQFFAEALVLGGLAAVAGLAAAGEGLRWALAVLEGQSGPLPFWFRDTLKPATILYAGALTVLGAVIAGVVPALKVTRGLHARLKAMGAGGGGLRFGGLWTAVIVTQIAVTVVFPVTAFFVRKDLVQLRTLEVGFRSENYLSARLEMDREAPAAGTTDTSRAAFQARFRAMSRELERRLAAEPEVAGVTLADRLPRMYHPYRLIEVDAGGAAPLRPEWPSGYRVSSASVDADYFDVLSVPLRSGRNFQSADLGQRIVIVNQSFVDRVLGNHNPIGRRVRYVHFEEWGRSKPDAEPGPWHEIIGVVRDMGMSAGSYDPKISGIYHPLADSGAFPVHVAVHVQGDPEAFGPRLREITNAIHPSLRVSELRRLDLVNVAELEFLEFWFQLTVMVSAIALLLSLAGIYAVMSFTVSRRTREIGIRVALGSTPRRIVAAIFRQPLRQVALGILAGGVLLTGLMFAAAGSLSAKQVVLIAVYVVVMMGVCMLACIVPTLRALQVEPTEALRAEG